MRIQHVDMVTLAKNISPKLNAWINESLPIDITVRRGVSNRGLHKVCFRIKGSTQEDILAKIEAIEKLLKGK